VGFIAYAFLTAALKFPEPYLQNDEPLLFTGNSDRQTVISSFGIREKDDHRYLELRHQLRVLHTNQDEDAELLTPFVAREGQALYAASSGRAEAAEKRLEMDFDSGSMF